MKFVHLFALAGVVLASGCASPARTGDAGAAGKEEGVVSLGSLIPRKGASRNDAVSKADLQSLENERTMNSNGLSTRQ